MKSYRFKRIASFLLVMAMLFEAGWYDNTFTAYATQDSLENTEEYSVADNSQVSAEGTDGFGELFASELNEKLNEYQRNEGYYIREIIVEGKNAEISYETQTAGKIIIGLYDDEQTTLITTASADVQPDQSNVSVEFENIETMPKYFSVKAYLLNMSMEPLCEEYSSDLYTKEMQDFLAATTDDFDSDLVYNLDEDKKNNFAVYNEDVVRVDNSENSDIIITEDENAGVYVIEHAGESFRSLKQGDVFSYDNQGELIICKIDSITTNEDTITITEGDCEITDVFDYVKIDNTGNLSDAEIDTSNLDEGITCLGFVNEDEESEENDADTHESELEYWNNSDKNESIFSNISFDGGGSLGQKLSYTVDKKEYNNGSEEQNTIKCSCSGGVFFSDEIEVKFLITLKKQSITFKNTLKLDVGLKFSGEGNFRILLGTLEYYISGVKIQFDVYFVLKGKLSGEFTASFKHVIGAELSIQNKPKDLSEKPTSDIKFYVEGSLFLGVDLVPALAVIDKKICTGELTISTGIQITARHKTKDKNHLCNHCIEGSIDLVISSFNYKLKFLKVKELKGSLIANLSYHLCDFFYSFDHHKFGWGKCIYRNPSLNIAVKNNENNKAIKNVRIMVDGIESCETDKNGKADVVVEPGEHVIKFYKSGFDILTENVLADTEDQKLNVNMKANLYDNLSAGPSVKVTALEDTTLNFSREHKIGYAKYSNGKLTDWDIFVSSLDLKKGEEAIITSYAKIKYVNNDNPVTVIDVPASGLVVKEIVGNESYRIYNQEKETIKPKLFSVANSDTNGWIDYVVSDSEKKVKKVEAAKKKIPAIGNEEVCNMTNISILENGFDIKGYMIYPREYEHFNVEKVDAYALKRLFLEPGESCEIVNEDENSLNFCTQSVSMFDYATYDNKTSKIEDYKKGAQYEGIPSLNSGKKMILTNADNKRLRVYFPNKNENQTLTSITEEALTKISLKPGESCEIVNGEEEEIGVRMDGYHAAYALYDENANVSGYAPSEMQLPKISAGYTCIVTNGDDSNIEICYPALSDKVTLKKTQEKALNVFTLNVGQSCSIVNNQDQPLIIFSQRNDSWISAELYKTDENGNPVTEQISSIPTLKPGESCNITNISTEPGVLYYPARMNPFSMIDTSEGKQYDGMNNESIMSQENIYDNFELDENNLIYLDEPESEMEQEKLIIASEKSESPNLTTLSFNNLTAGNNYILFVLKNDKEDLFSDDNILYIEQTYADDDGCIEFAFNLREAVDNPVVILGGTGVGIVSDNREKELEYYVVTAETTVDELSEEYFYLLRLVRDHQVVDDTDVNIGTGNVLQLVNKDNTIFKEYLMLVKGDCDGNGEIDLIDLEMLHKHLLDIQQLSETGKKAAMMAEEETDVSVVDMEMMQKHILGIAAIE